MLYKKTKRALRFFNYTGPCNPYDHYMLPPADRLVGAQLHRYIRDELYWVLHAPRQTGKTTFLKSWMYEINAGDEAIACYVSVETCQGVPSPEIAIPTICHSLAEYAEAFGVPVPQTPKDLVPNKMLSEMLSGWANLVAPKPLIVLFDEVDVLQGEALISFLRQLRGGFAKRAIGNFPVSIALVGMRDLKDYITMAKGGLPVNPGSPFNIKSDSAHLTNFSKEDVINLFAQRTAENGQQITNEAIEYVYDQSRGQPWIVNSLFARATLRILDENSTETVELKHVERARYDMVLARETHLDALAYRLEEPGIRSIIEPIMLGDTYPDMAKTPIFKQCLDLGLVGLEDGTPVVANPIYREVIARHLTYSPQLAIPRPEWQWENADGSLDMDRMLVEFQEFWRENSDMWETRMNSEYTEAFPHLLLMAFLQRVLNGGGDIEREYAAGRGRMDLCVKYNGFRYIIEIKLLRSYNSPELIRKKGLEQIAKYRDTFSPETPAYLVIFDRREERKAKSWDERLSWEKVGEINLLYC
jgi:hypothetical protein